MYTMKREALLWRRLSVCVLVGCEAVVGKIPLHGNVEMY